MYKLKHINNYFFVIIILFVSCYSKAQNQSQYIDSVRNQYQIPAIAYAVVSSDSVIELGLIGQSNINLNNKISSTSRFHLGSNTKAITGLIASNLVQQGLLKWNTSLFEIFPEFKHLPQNNNYTFSDLLNFKVPLSAFSYNTEIPDSIYTGKNDFEQRYYIAQYLLKQKSVDENEKGLYLTNTGYVLAGLMMERASGKSYEQLVDELGTKLSISFQFGIPSKNDTNQTYGHDDNSNPLTKENIKLNWLLSAGNINISISDYVKLIQTYLLAIEGQSTFYSKQQMDYLLKSPDFSFGWFKQFYEETTSNVYYNFGNATGFMSSVFILREKSIGIFVFANKSSESTECAIGEISDKLKIKYCN